MPKPRNQSPSSLAAACAIILNRQSFWIFNDGPADRFGLFKKEEQKKVETEQQLQQGRIAYNYQRYNREIEQTSWTLFYEQLTDQLFTEFDHILVKPDGQIRGIKNHHSRLLSTHPDAYSTARKASRSLSTK
ncbi:MAG: hypothetical protein A2Y94_05570 [Caldithrix sp. RBG_13_44_9]|nr:MAG: hypothetical protein A2Y94_05570 [Caldithrix sp. RBG_13_44_9]